MGAARGTIYHRALECMDLRHEITEDSLRDQIAEMVRSRKITARGGGGPADPPSPAVCPHPPSGGGCRRPARRGTLKREQPFVMGIPASQARAGWPEEEQILVQGIIDAYFEERGRQLRDRRL